MAASDLDGEDGIVGINVTPLVDIILVLLVIFMVTTTTIQNVEGLDVDKPDAKTGQDVKDLPTSILLVCDKDGRVLVDGEEAKDDALVIQRIKSKVEENPDLQGIVQCDERADVGKMVHLIDLLRDNEVKKYAIATEPPKDAAAGDKG